MAPKSSSEERLKRFLFLFTDSVSKFIAGLKEKYRFNNIVRIENCVFLTDDKNIGKPIVYSHICLGFFFNNNFVPSNLLLKELLSWETNKVLVDDKSALRFIYGNECLYSRKKVVMPQKSFLVMFNDACIGFGRVKRDKVFPFYDIGLTERLELNNHLNL